MAARQPATQLNAGSSEGALTRELLLSGDLPRRIAAAMPDVRLTTDAERAASLVAMLDERPEHGDGVWVFAYGSLIWNPAIHIAGRQHARAVGWHRSFCLSARMGRGTPDNPGVMLGLRPTGDCPGVVLRIAEDMIEQELDLLWRREMVASGYIPRWVPVEDADGRSMGAAIAFTVNEEQPSYCGHLPEEEIVRRIATARGGLGTAAEYLFRTRDGLAEMGITDAFLERMAMLVSEQMDTPA